jgi:DNA polymerase III delta prime subunit
MSEHVFISYARKDGEAHALQFDRELPKRGFKTWRDKRGIDPTQDFTAEIEKAIEAAAYVVTCITPDVRRDDSFVRREIAYAQVVDKPIIVARFADVPPPISVVNHTWLDFFKGWESAFQRLCDLLKQPAGNYTPPPPQVDDPYKPYLDALYKQIVRYLDKTVFSMLPGQSSIALITLRSEDTPDAVQMPEEIEAQALPLAFFDMAGVGGETRDKGLKPVVYDSFHAAFEKYDGRVLLLGEPGAGKTTTLFAFARDKVAQRLQDTTQPLPILAPIALWDADKQPPLATWLAQSVPALKNDVAGILSEGKVLLLLDGLDELGDERLVDPQKPMGEKYDPRLRFIRIIPNNNQILISCRIKDYNDTGEKLALKGAVTLHPLDDAQMQVYLKDMPELWEVLQKDEELREVARTPLLLSFFTFAFAGLDEEAKQLRDLSKGDVRDKIFETYVRRRYEHEMRKPHASHEFTVDDIYRVLGYASWYYASDYRVRNSRLPRPSETEYQLRREFDTRDLTTQFDNQTAQVFLETAEELHLVTVVAINGSSSIPSTYSKRYRFLHLLFRDHFAYRYMLTQLQSPHVYKRGAAAVALAASRDTRYVIPIRKLLADQDSSVLRKALAALHRLNDDETFIHLMLNTEDKDILEQSITYCLSRDIDYTVWTATLNKHALNPRVVVQIATPVVRRNREAGLQALSAVLDGLLASEPTVFVQNQPYFSVEWESAVRTIINVFQNNHYLNLEHLFKAHETLAKVNYRSLTHDDTALGNPLLTSIVEGLGLYGADNERAFEIVTQSLRSMHFLERRSAIVAAGRLKNARFVPQLIVLINDRLAWGVNGGWVSVSGELFNCKQAVAALKSIGTEQALAAIEGVVCQEDYSVGG